MTTDFRAQCAELLEWAERTSSHYYKQADVIIRARAALAEPEPEGPSDEELRDLWQNTWDTSEEHGAFQFARAVLSRWGNHPESPDSSTQPS